MLPGIGALVDSGLILGTLPLNISQSLEHALSSRRPAHEGTTPANSNMASLEPYPTSTTHGKILIYEIDCSYPRPIPLPHPESAWLEHNVDQQNWAIFVVQLAENQGNRAAQKLVVEQWNIGFFGPRDCHVMMAPLPDNDQDGSRQLVGAVEEATETGCEQYGVDVDGSCVKLEK